jgi:hypothetical protein
MCCNMYSVGFRTNEALWYLSYEAPYLDPEGSGHYQFYHYVWNRSERERLQF